MDVANGSRTARVVAVGRAVGVGGRRDALVADLLPAGDRALVRAARAVGAGTRSRVVGWTGHPGLRMLAVDAAVVSALEASRAHSLVIIGAGYDTRAWRLDELAGRTVLELDHPATQGAKRRRLRPVEEALADDLRLVPADLATAELRDVLDRAGHDPSQPTVWLWEAVVPYLPEEAVDRTLAAVAARSLPGDRLVLTTVTDHLFDPPWLGRGLRSVARRVMHAIGEPVRLAESDADVADRLARHGWRLRSTSGVRQWAVDAGLELVGPALDERLHVAERVGAP